MDQDRLRQFGVQLSEAITLSQDLLAISEQDKPNLDELERGFISRSVLIDKIYSDSRTIVLQSEFPETDRDHVLKSFKDLKEIDAKLRDRLSILLDQRKRLLQEVQRNEVADKRYHKKQRVDYALFIRNKLEG